MIRNYMKFNVLILGDQPMFFVCARPLCPARVHDARAVRSNHNKEGMEGREVWARRLVYDEALLGMV